MADEAESRDQTPTVVEFGRVDSDEPDVRRRSLARAMGGTGRTFRAVARDRRLAPVVAGLAAVAAFASLVGEWQVATIAFDPEENVPREVTAGVSALGGLGTAYIVGVLGLAGCMALTLFGSPGPRRHARIVSLAIAGALGALLFAIVAQLDQLGTPFNGYIEWGFPAPPTASAGRGLEAAFVTVGLAGLASYLAGRLRYAGAGERLEADPPAGQVAPEGFRPAVPAQEGERRPRDPADPDAADAPLDLSVGPATPFQHLPDDRV